MSPADAPPAQADATGAAVPPEPATGLAAASSFFWPMRLLGRHKRRGVLAIYAYCRAVDDIADGPDHPEVKLAGLAAWRHELERIFADRPETRLGKLLAHTVRRYDLPRQPFNAILDGMHMDVRGQMCAPSLATLDLYCRRVAGSVGLLVLPVLGERSPAGEQFALALGRALQLTNILRDLGEDGALDRLYVPREWLIEADIAADRPGDVLRHGNLYRIRNRFVVEAEDSFAAARAALAELERPRRVWPALAMMAIYRRLLRRLAAAPPPHRPGAAPNARLGRREKLAIAASIYLCAKLRPKRLLQL